MKELSIEEKANRYDDRFEKAKKWYDANTNEGYRGIFEDIFPELKESEDESIRKWLICTLKSLNNSPVQIDGAYEMMLPAIAWLEKQGNANKEYWRGYREGKQEILDKYAELEKQGEQKSFDYENANIQQKDFAPKVEPKFHEGECLVNVEYGNVVRVLKVLEDNYRLDFGGDTIGTLCTELVDSDYRLWNIIQDAKDGDVLSDGTTIFIFKDSLSDGSVMSYCDYDIDSGDSNAFCSLSMNLICSKITPVTKEQYDTFFAKMKEAGYEWDAEKKELKKILQNPANKVEPKFKVGNWYKCTKDFFGKGVTFDKNIAYYCAKEGCLQNEYGCHIVIVKDLYDNFKLWTIEDAKDGDVLYCESSGIEYIVMSKGINRYGNIDSYFRYNSLSGFDINIPSVLSIKKDYITPATKEQHDLLFQKMHEAGYEWDFEKKELKNIEQKTPWLNELKEKLDSMSKEELQQLWDKYKQPFEPTNEALENPAWSEDDNIMVHDIDYALRSQIIYPISKLQSMATWINNLKNRVQPKQDWGERDEKFLNDAISLAHECDDIELRDWLKSIKEKVQPKQEWSEKDDTFFKAIIRDIENIKYISEDAKKDRITWFKSLKYRVQPKPKIEWTLTDRNLMSAAIAFVKQNNSFNCWAGVTKDDVVAFLRSLRLQNTWKPSKGQLESLEYAIEKAEKDWFPLINNRIYLTLKALKEQLEKL